MQEKFKRQDEKAAIATRFIRRKAEKSKQLLHNYYVSFLNVWYKQFKKDFGGSTPSHMEVSLSIFFKKLFSECCEKWDGISAEEMNNELAKLRTHEDIQPWLWRAASKQNMSVFKKHDLKKHLNNLSGFTITNSKTHKVIAGEYFDLSLEDVKNILKVKDRRDK